MTFPERGMHATVKLTSSRSTIFSDRRMRFQWEIRELGAVNGPVIDSGIRPTIAKANDSARIAIRYLLDTRIAYIENDTNDHHEVAECPQCGDPADAVTIAYPGGFLWTLDCESCGHRDSESA